MYIYYGLENNYFLCIIFCIKFIFFTNSFLPPFSEILYMSVQRKNSVGVLFMCFWGPESLSRLRPRPVRVETTHFQPRQKKMDFSNGCHIHIIIPTNMALIPIDGELGKLSFQHWIWPVARKTEFLERFFWFLSGSRTHDPRRWRRTTPDMGVIFQTGTNEANIQHK